MDNALRILQTVDMRRMEMAAIDWQSNNIVSGLSDSSQASKLSRTPWIYYPCGRPDGQHMRQTVVSQPTSMTKEWQSTPAAQMPRSARNVSATSLSSSGWFLVYLTSHTED